MTSTTFKRVISNPDEVGRDNSKISKQSSNPSLMMDSLAIGSGQKVEEATNLASLNNQNNHHTSTNQRNNNESENNNQQYSAALGTPDKLMVDNNQNSNNNNDTSNLNHEFIQETTGRKESTGNDEMKGDGSGMARQVSVDSSTANPHAPPKVIEVTRTTSASSSVIRNKSESTVGSSAGNAARDWGWFEDIHDHSSKGNNKSPSDEKRGGSSRKKGGLLLFHDLVNPLNDIITKTKPNRDSEPMMAVTAPTYVLEESRSTQRLWRDTAGHRPPQPVDERAFYEKVWAQNFQRSHVDYQIPSDVLTATSPINLSPFADGNFDDAGPSLPGPDDFSNTERDGGTLTSEVAAVSSIASKGTTGFYGGTSRSKNRKEALMGPHNHHHTLVNKRVKDDGTDDELTVLVRGDNVFGTTVSKSFTKDDKTGIDTVSVSIASYRVVESKKHGKYAQFLVIFCEGTFQDTVGVWKRYSDFEQLSRRVSHGHENCTSVLAGIHPLSVTEDPHEEMLPNAITSWNLLKKRKRWYRCLDAGYLSLKAFLLERFLHDILFESSTATILREFVGITV